MNIYAEKTMQKYLFFIICHKIKYYFLQRLMFAPLKEVPSIFLLQVYLFDTTDTEAQAITDIAF